MEKEEDLKQWRKDSDNFKGSSEDRDRLFEELEKQRNLKNDRRK